jgi:membrane protease YdiL (CAAX protease family)
MKRMNTFLVRQLLAAFATLLLWAGAAACYTYMPPIAGIPWLMVVLGLFWYVVIRRASASSRHRVPIVVALPRTPLWVLGSTIAAAVPFYVAFQTYYFRLMPPRPDATTAFDSYTHQPLGWVATFVASALVLPVMEETVFRGWVLRSIERRAGTAAALALSATIFSAFHLELWAAPFHMVSGLLFGLVALRTNSVGAAMLVHMVANATEKTMSAVAGPSPASWPDVLAIPSVAQPVLAIAAVAGLIAALWLLGACGSAPSPSDRVALGAWS